MRVLTSQLIELGAAEPPALDGAAMRIVVGKARRVAGDEVGRASAPQAHAELRRALSSGQKKLKQAAKAQKRQRKSDQKETKKRRGQKERQSSSKRTKKGKPAQEEPPEVQFGD